MHGFGDQLMEMQQTSWAIGKIRAGSFQINMCFAYGDEDDNIFAMVSGDCSKDTAREEDFCDCRHQVG